MNMNGNDYHRPDGSGMVQGDDRPMPMKNVGSMAPDNCADDGCDLGPDATNRMGSMVRSSKSDPMEAA